MGKQILKSTSRSKIERDVSGDKQRQTAIKEEHDEFENDSQDEDLLKYDELLEKNQDLRENLET